MHVVHVPLRQSYGRCSPASSASSRMYSSSATSMVMPLLWKVTLCDLAMSAPVYLASKSHVLVCSSIPAVPLGELCDGFHPARPAERSNDFEVAHHHVLVFEVVAVEDVASPVAVETDEHTRPVEGLGAVPRAWLAVDVAGVGFFLPSRL